MEKLPFERKKLSNTLRRCREREGIEAGERLKQPPEAPETLSDAGKREWDNLAPVLCELGVLTYADLRSLELLCSTLATASELEKAILEDGFLLPAANGGRKSNPTIKILETTRNAAHRMLGDFGLSPKARKFVSKAPGPTKDNPFAKYRQADKPSASLDE